MKCWGNILRPSGLLLEDKSLQEHGNYFAGEESWKNTSLPQKSPVLQLERTRKSAMTVVRSLGTDPCQLVWQVNEFGCLQNCTVKRDPCRLVRQVNEFGSLENCNVNETPAGLSGR